MSEKSFWKEKKDKNWLKNFWFYYKYRIILGAMLITFFTVWIVSCVRSINYDLIGYYIGEDPVGKDFRINAANKFKELIDDVNDDGEINFDLQNLTSGDVDNITSESDYAMQTAIQFEMIEGEGYLYLLDEVFYKHCLKTELLKDISDITGDSSAVYAISVENNPLIKEIGYSSDKNLYMCVRVINTKQRSEDEQIKFQNNALKIIKYFYSYK